MSIPWWIWPVVALWSLPAMRRAYRLAIWYPSLALDEKNEPYPPPTLFEKLVRFPVFFAVMFVLWPLAYWSDLKLSRECRRSYEE